MSMFEEQQGGPFSPRPPTFLPSDLAPAGYFWGGDLAGFEVGAVQVDNGEIVPVLYHRCGWASILERPEGICGDYTGYLGNIVETALNERRHHACANYQRGQAQTVDQWLRKPYGAAPVFVRHWHDPSTECVCPNPGPPALPRQKHWVKIEGRMVPDTGLLAWLESDPNRPTAVYEQRQEERADFVPGALAAIREVIGDVPCTGHGPEDYPEEAHDATQ